MCVCVWRWIEGRWRRIIRILGRKWWREYAVEIKNGYGSRELGTGEIDDDNFFEMGKHYQMPKVFEIILERA